MDGALSFLLSPQDAALWKSDEEMNFWIKVASQDSLNQVETEELPIDYKNDKREIVVASSWVPLSTGFYHQRYLYVSSSWVPGTRASVSTA